MSSNFFEYCGIDVERDTPSGLVVRRTRPSIAVVLVVLFPLPLLGLLIVRRLSARPAVLFSLVLLAVGAYCIQSYRSIRPRTWIFDRERRQARVDGERIHPFERLIRVEFDQEEVRKGHQVYTRFSLTLCWIAGPERAFVSRLGSELGALAAEIADYVGVPLIHTANGRELYTFEVVRGDAGADLTRRF